MSRILLLTSSPPAVEGHGGQHRTYQILHDLRQTPGVSEVEVFSSERYYHQYRHDRGLRARFFRAAAALHMRIALLRDNPLRLLRRNNYARRIYGGWRVVGDYRRLIAHKRPDLCVFDHTRFYPILRLNKRLGIPTIAACHNLDALHGRLSPHDPLQIRSMLLDFGLELDALRQTEARLCISRVETAVLNGLGYPARYYPYWPVGQIAEVLARTRARRQPQKGLFLILGSLYNDISREGVENFLGETFRRGLPEGVQIKGIGRGWERFSQQTQNLPQLEAHGFVPQETLEDYLSRAQGVLILTQSGFGVLTRLAEMSASGVPVICFPHPMYAIDPLPGITTVENWDKLWDALQRPVPEPIPALEVNQGESILSQTVRWILGTGQS
ncbi:MAG: glycosyltransferase [Anaerolinea sp.]|nr:glycosyltransferase [Anaerolinea sp.]